MNSLPSFLMTLATYGPSRSLGYSKEIVMWFHCSHNYSQDVMHLILQFPSYIDAFDLTGLEPELQPFFNSRDYFLL